MTKDRLEWIISGLDFNLLTPWEEQFVEDMEKRLKDQEKDLTERQEEILERIYREKSR